LTITLTNTLISGWSQSGGSDRPTESLTLNFTKIQFSDKIEGGTGTVPTNILKPTPSPSPKPKT
jgi:type VI secretion system secreted protein Hcp